MNFTLYVCIYSLMAFTTNYTWFELENANYKIKPDTKMKIYLQYYSHVSLKIAKTNLKDKNKNVRVT